MKAAAAVLAAICFALATAALPAQVDERQDYEPCTGVFGIPGCCNANSIGIYDIDCHSTPTMPTDAADFKDMCAVRDQQARCCAMANGDADDVSFCDRPPDGVDNQVGSATWGAGGWDATPVYLV